MVTGGYDGKKRGCISCRSVELLNLDGTRHCSMEPLPEDWSCQRTSDAIAKGLCKNYVIQWVHPLVWEKMIVA